MLGPVLQTFTAAGSHYLLGKDAAVTTFQTAMDKCASLGAHSVHINTREEHQVIKDYINNHGEYLS